MAADQEFNLLISKLKSIDFKGQYAEKAQQEITPFRSQKYNEDLIRSSKKAAVLLNIHPKKGKAFFTLIERPEYDGAHSSQISFPGGKVEKDDKNLITTALREAQEEVNIVPSQVEIIAQLSPIYIPPSNFYVNAYVGFSRTRPNYRPDKKEVKNIMEVAIQKLLHPEVIETTTIQLKNGTPLKTPFLNLDDKVVWGATAVLLNEFRHHLLSQK